MTTPATPVPEHSIPPAWTRLSPGGARRLAIALTAGGLLTSLYALIGEGFGDDWPWLIPTAACAIVGPMVLVQRPAHAIGWLFTWFGAVSGVAGLAITAAERGLPPGAVPPLPAASLPAWSAWAFVLAEASSTVAVAAFVPLSLLLFPDGRLPSRRWRWTLAAVVAACVTGGTATVLTGGWGGDPEQAFVVGHVPPAAARVGEALSGVFFPLLSLIWLAGAAGLLGRFRRARGIERQQLKWVALAAAFSIAVSVGTGLLGGGVLNDTVATVLTATAFAATPVAAALAILRYRLWDIDLVIRRSVVVAGVVVFVTGLYVALVVGVGRLLGADADDPVFAVLATAVVAIAFQPAREWLERLANRMVYGRRATPFEVLAGFSRRLAGTDASDEALVRVAGLLAEGTGATATGVWVRVGDQLRLAATAEGPSGESPGVGGAGMRTEHPLPSDDALPLLEADLASPVTEGGELLGALTLTKPRGEPPTPADEALLRRLAGQLALALRNERLTAELRERLTELDESRRRLLSASDAGRRQIEQRLETATGAALGALEVGVAEVRAEAEAAGATRTATLLERTRIVVVDARSALADLAAGLYPPELAEHGLAGALARLPDRVAVPVTCDLADVGRLDPAAELALWFTTQEALQNAGKHAADASARVTLRRDGDSVELAVTDSGPGFDPATAAAGAGLQNLRDRLAAARGTLDVRSAPGAGTTVVARVPAPAP